MLTDWLWSKSRRRNLMCDSNHCLPWAGLCRVGLLARGPAGPLGCQADTTASSGCELRPWERSKVFLREKTATLWLGCCPVCLGSAGEWICQLITLSIETTPQSRLRMAAALLPPSSTKQLVLASALKANGPCWRGSEHLVELCRYS